MATSKVLKKYAIMIGSTPYVVSAKTKKEAYEKLAEKTPVKIKLKDVYLY